MHKLGKLPGGALFLIALFGVAGPGRAQSNAGQAELIQQLLERIDRLEKRVNELESGKGGAPPQPVAQAVPAPNPSNLAPNPSNLAPNQDRGPGSHEHGAPGEV